jgi:hypothetical protein
VPKKQRRKFSLKRFWAGLRLFPVEVGAEWERKPTARPKRKPRPKALALLTPPPPQLTEALIREQILAEQMAAETPLQQMLREVEEESAQRFRKALKRRNLDLVEIGLYGAVRATANNMRKPKPPQSYW